MTQPLIVGFTSSLRNCRGGGFASALAGDVAGLATQDELMDYLRRAAEHSGPREENDFSGLKQRRRNQGKGLSNSETGLAAALWGAHQEGARVRCVSLPDQFLDGAEPNPAALDMAGADGLVLSTPTYFGDRSSSCMHFIEHLRGLGQALPPGLVSGNVAVGAKRNGGQETTLIYLMLDLMNIGFLGVGNDTSTTAQYGGTGHAGDVGAMVRDDLGLQTSIGTGRRVARVASIAKAGRTARLRDDLRVAVLSLQRDRAGRSEALLDELLAGAGVPGVSFSRIDLTSRHIRPCNACNVCPSRIGPDEEYRCFIRDDDMADVHRQFQQVDVIVPVIHSPRDRADLLTSYQVFMERTRYMRRGDYMLSNRLVVPLILEELGANENMHVRIITSFIRHHTIMHRPLVGVLRDGVLLNDADLRLGLAGALSSGRRMTAGRLALHAMDSKLLQYNPVGYVLANRNGNELHSMELRRRASEERQRRLAEESRRRVDLGGSGE